MLLKMSEPAANDDLELLRQFTRDHSQAAFTALVQRHVNLVYSAALRQVRSPQLAEEIAQSVFADLARDGAKLKPDTALVAWLHSVTRRTAVDVIRKESRRQLREQLAYEMNITNAPDASWQHIEPLLDEAMAELDETDRAAVLLRYFENQSLRAVGQQLGVSDDAAQKRVSRAVERLRDFFAKRGVTVGAGGLVVVISANAVQAAPVGLAVTISAAALAGTAATTSTIIAATTKTIAMTTLQKTLVAATVAVLAGAGIYEARQAAQLRDRVQTLQQQQAPLTGQIEKLENEYADATNRLAGLVDELATSKKNNSELLKLRGEVGVLRGYQNEASRLRQENEQLRTGATGFENQTNQFVSASAPWASVGASTPRALLQSLAWALTQENKERAKSLIVWDEKGTPEQLASNRELQRTLAVESSLAPAVEDIDSIKIISIAAIATAERSDEVIVKFEKAFKNKSIQPFSVTAKLRLVGLEWRAVGEIEYSQDGGVSLRLPFTGSF
jgi:RNA polymerase sigma factor (sigma-70 family)